MQDVKGSRDIHHTLTASVFVLALYLSFGFSFHGKSTTLYAARYNTTPRAIAGFVRNRIMNPVTDNINLSANTFFVILLVFRINNMDEPSL